MLLQGNSDGINISLVFTPREAKVIILALEQLDDSQFQAIAKNLNAHGFDHKPLDILAVVRQTILASTSFTAGVKGPFHVSPTTPQDPAEVIEPEMGHKKDPIVN